MESSQPSSATGPESHPATRALIQALEQICSVWGWKARPEDFAAAMQMLRSRGWQGVIPAALGFALNRGARVSRLAAVEQEHAFFFAIGKAWLAERRVILLPGGAERPTGTAEARLEDLNRHYSPGGALLNAAVFARSSGNLVQAERMETAARSAVGAVVRLDALPEPAAPYFGEKQAPPCPIDPPPNQSRSVTNSVPHLEGWKAIVGALSAAINRQVSEREARRLLERAKVKPQRTRGRVSMTSAEVQRAVEALKP